VGTDTHGTPREYSAAANPPRSVSTPPPMATTKPSRCSPRAASASHISSTSPSVLLASLTGRATGGPSRVDAYPSSGSRHCVESNRASHRIAPVPFSPTSAHNSSSRASAPASNTHLVRAPERNAISSSAPGTLHLQRADTSRALFGNLPRGHSGNLNAEIGEAHVERITRCRELHHATSGIRAEQWPAGGSPRGAQVRRRAQPDQMTGSPYPVAHCARRHRATSESDHRPRATYSAPHGGRFSRPKTRLLLRSEDLGDGSPGSALDVLIEVDARDPELRGQ